jgi:hypothetical protein
LRGIVLDPVLHRVHFDACFFFWKSKYSMYVYVENMMNGKDGIISDKIEFDRRSGGWRSRAWLRT